jgi:hypothetical protein
MNLWVMTQTENFGVVAGTTFFELPDRYLLAAHENVSMERRGKKRKKELVIK